MNNSVTYEAYEKLGRVRLSDHFFMRDFLYSSIADCYGISNYPDDPKLAIEAGTQLCQNLLEPLMKKFGHLTIRSAYRSPKVNELGNQKGHDCARNDKNYAAHIWDYKDKENNIGATACIQVHWFAEQYEKGADWQSLAWWIHDHLPYNSAFFFRNRAALNLNWRENPKRWIRSYIGSNGKYLTKLGMDNWDGDHSSYYNWIDEELSK